MQVMGTQKAKILFSLGKLKDKVKDNPTGIKRIYWIEDQGGSNQNMKCFGLHLVTETRCLLRGGGGVCQMISRLAAKRASSKAVKPSK